MFLEPEKHQLLPGIYLKVCAGSDAFTGGWRMSVDSPLDLRLVTPSGSVLSFAK